MVVVVESTEGLMVDTNRGLKEGVTLGSCVGIMVDAIGGFTVGSGTFGWIEEGDMDGAIDGE